MDGIQSELENKNRYYCYILDDAKECPRNERRYLRIENMSNGASSINLNILNCFIFRFRDFSRRRCWPALKYSLGTVCLMLDRKTKRTLIINLIMDRFSLTTMAIYNLRPREFNTTWGHRRDVLEKKGRILSRSRSLNRDPKFTTNHRNVDACERRYRVTRRAHEKQGTEPTQRRARKKK